MARLAKQADVSISSIKRFENELPQPVSADILNLLQQALTKAGICFLPDTGQGPGVRLNARPTGTSS